MKALAWNKTNHNFGLLEMDEPALEAPDHVKLRVLEVGVCGTDRDEVQHDRAIAPEAEDLLILGHEMIGRVVEVGHLVTKVKPGDLALFTVRRGCGQCPACDKEAYDMCYTDKYTERGIKGINGYQTEFVVDHQRYLIKVPEELRNVGVLCEPTSVVEKAIDLVAKIQKERLPDWAAAEKTFQGRHILIAGVGAIGLLAAMVLILEGAQVWGYDIVDPHSSRAKLLEEMGGKYICAKETKTQDINKITKHIDVILEAAGNTKLDFDLLNVLSENGAYVLTGVTPKNDMVSFDGGTTMENMVLKNQVVVGSVNANIRHWEKAIQDLLAAKKRWKNIPDAFITNRYTPSDYKTPFYTRPEDEIKTIVVWNKE